MEKLAYYLFMSGLITVGLMLLSYSAELIGRLAARRVSVASTASGAEISNVDFADPGEGVGRYGTMLGWLSVVILGFAITIRASESGRGPFGDMYDFSIAFAWGIIFVYLLVERRYQARVMGLMVIPFALGLMLYARSLPADIRPLVPALQNQELLTLHVSAAIIAYSCFAVSFGTASLYLIQERFKLQALPDLDVLDDAGFLSAALGFPFMALVLILGAYWANTAWGRYWGWDPKETASFVTWLLYAGYLHTRALREWRGRRSAVLLVIGFIAVMLTYFGNLFFGGLHSYG